MSYGVTGWQKPSWCHSEVDVWPFRYKFSWVHLHFPVRHLCEIMSEFVFELLSYDVTMLYFSYISQNSLNNILYSLHSIVSLSHTVHEQYKAANKKGQRRCLCSCSEFQSIEAVLSFMTHFSLHIVCWSKRVNVGLDSEWHPNLVLTGNV